MHSPEQWGDWFRKLRRDVVAVPDAPELHRTHDLILLLARQGALHHKAACITAGLRKECDPDCVHSICEALLEAAGER